MKTIRLRLMILAGMLAMTLCGATESTASPGLSISITPASPGATAVATVTLTDVSDIESFSLELNLGTGTALQLPPTGWFARGAYFPATPFGSAPTVELNNTFESAALTKVFIDGFKPTGLSGTIGTVSFTVNPSAIIGDNQDITLSGVYFSKASLSVMAFVPSTAHFVVTTISTHDLNVAFTGSGTGTVTSNPPGLACNTNTSKSYSAGSVLTLHSEPGDFSLFSGWSGICEGLNDCSITMDADKSVTATFTKDTAHQVRLDGTTQTFYSSILNAMSDAATGDTIKAWGTDFTENISLIKNNALIFKGGYDNIGYTSNTGMTVITGTLTISNGTLTVEKLILRKGM